MRNENRPLYWCEDCGALFDEGKPLTEDHGETFVYCPECMSGNYRSTADMVCEACGGVCKDQYERFCEECKWIVKREMNKTITTSQTRADARLSIETYVSTIQNLINEEVPQSTTEELICGELLKAVWHIVSDCECSITSALEMVEAWSKNKL